jgi:putative CocE/NonD family hydrolase
VAIDQRIDQRIASDRAWWADEPLGAASPPVPYARRSVYIPTRDGVRLAADIYLPADLPAGTKLPTILHSTRYHRRRLPRDPNVTELISSVLSELEVRRYMGAGYALVSYDERGSGASFGSRHGDPDLETIRDARDVCDWVVEQPWCDGRLGATGISYEGTTAENATRSGHPALRAAVVRFSYFDAVMDGMFPGGVNQSWLIDDWMGFVTYLDRNQAEEYFATVAPEAMRPMSEISRGVAPVDEDADGSLLRAAVAEHAKNVNIRGWTGTMRWRDDPETAAHSERLGIDRDQTAALHLDEIIRGGVRVYSYCGWYDSAYGWAAVKRFKALEEHGGRLLMGPWDHGGSRNADPTNPTREAAFDQIGEVIRFFDEVVKGEPEPAAPPVRYFTFGEGWKSANTWPPSEFVHRPLFFGAQGALHAAPPTVVDAHDDYVVDPTHTTGIAARWRSVMNFYNVHIEWPDRVDQDKRLQVYDSAPLETSLEVTGHPIAVLFLSSSSDDASLFVYLEEVTADGEVRYVTEGTFRARHRAIDSAAPAWDALGTPHSYSVADDQPLVPGEPAEIRFGLHPISYRFAAGSRVRIAVGGADADNFVMVPEQPATLGIRRELDRPSHILLPVTAEAQLPG